MVKLLKKVLCLSLRIAGLVIGGLDIAGSVLQSFALGHLTLNLNNFADALNEFWIPENKDIKEKRRVAVIVFVYIYLVETVINGVLSVLLVSGIRKKRHLMILPWLILNAIDIFINVLTLSFFLYVMSDDFKEFQFISVLKVLKLALLCYIYFAIYSLYIIIKTNNERTEHSEAVYTEVAPIQ